MAAVTSLISAGADVNDVDDEVGHRVCSVSPHTLSDGLVCDVISLVLYTVCRHTGWSYFIDAGCQEW